MKSARRSRLRGIALIASLMMLWPQSVHASWPGKNGRIAFTSVRYDKAAIVSMSPTGDHAVRLSAPSHSEGTATYSPDGNQIVFHRRLTRHRGDLFVMDADGTDVHRLTRRALDDIDPAWSPHGTKIIYP